jgi:hypothetical protein
LPLFPPGGKIQVEKGGEVVVDTDKLRNLVYQFSFYSKPSSGDSSAPCTVGDINRVVDKVSNVLNAFVDELEKNK